MWMPSEMPGWADCIISALDITFYKGSDPAKTAGGPAAAASDVEPEVHDVSILDDIFLAFDSELPIVTGGCFRPILNVICIGDDLGLDKTFLEVRMDHRGRLRRLPSTMYGPGP